MNIPHIPRGMRNNNPGNVMAMDNDTWLGQVSVGTNGEAIFSNPLWGLRAMYICLHDSVEKHGCMNLPAIITRYAPPETNDTERYIDDVVEWSGLTRGFCPANANDYALLMSAMCRQEQGMHVATMGMCRLAVYMKDLKEDFTK